MCLIISAFQRHPRYPVILVANRDEFFSRPTLPAHFQQTNNPECVFLAGKDLAQGGTWLGVNNTGQFAAVTNIRDRRVLSKAPASRGQLVSDFLHNSQSPADYLKALIPHLSRFAGFNLLLGDQNSLYYLNSLEKKIHNLGQGVYGLSNAALDVPWPKVTLGKNRLLRIVDNVQPTTTDTLIDLLLDRDIAGDERLPHTGVPLEIERRLSASFITDSDRQYGTRCTTAVTISDGGELRFCEQNYREDSSVSSRRFFSFRLHH